VEARASQFKALRHKLQCFLEEEGGRGGGQQDSFKLGMMIEVVDIIIEALKEGGVGR